VPAHLLGTHRPGQAGCLFLVGLLWRVTAARSRGPSRLTRFGNGRTQELQRQVLYLGYTPLGYSDTESEWEAGEDEASAQTESLVFLCAPIVCRTCCRDLSFHHQVFFLSNLDPI
jgi:hypothetical protein